VWDLGVCVSYVIRCTNNLTPKVNK
jgi:hypothetical protein